MATIFPTSPAPQVNDEYQGYRYNGTSWEIIGVDLTGDYQPRVASVSNTELGYLDGVTSAIQTQLNAKSPLASPTFTGTVTIPAGASISGFATETYVGTAISNLIDAAPTTLNTLNELAAALGDDASYASTITTALGTKAPLESPTFTGTVVLPSTTSIGNVTSTEIGYLDGVTSAIQTQLGAQTTALSNHEADTTAIHGITDTSKLATIVSASVGRKLSVQATAPSSPAVGDIWFQVTGL